MISKIRDNTGEHSNCLGLPDSGRAHWSDMRPVRITPHSNPNCSQFLQHQLEMPVGSLKILAPRSRVHYYPVDSQGGSKIVRVLTIAMRAVILCAWRIKLLTVVNFDWFEIMLDSRITKAFRRCHLIRIGDFRLAEIALLNESWAGPVRLPAFESLARPIWGKVKIQQRLSFASLCNVKYQRIST
jgi:hypothetical protein